MNVTLTPQHEAVIRRKVDSGLYPTPDAVLEAAFRLLDEHDRTRRRLLDALAEGERGDAVPYTPDLMKQLRAEADELNRQGKPIEEPAAVGLEQANTTGSDRAVTRRLTPEDQERALAALDRAERLQEKILVDRGGEPFSPSWELLDEARNERTRQLP